ncbi:hypothetical protein Hanom_Chr15g01405991 [Helianthus anomalus]
MISWRSRLLKLLLREQHVKETDQKLTTEKADVSTIEVTTKPESSDVLDKTVEQCKKCMKTCSACTKKDEKFRTRDMEFTKIERVFKDKCKEMFEKEKVLIDNDEKLT